MKRKKNTEAWLIVNGKHVEEILTLERSKVKGKDNNIGIF
jgi:hypothetical protein